MSLMSPSCSPNVLPPRACAAVPSAARVAAVVVLALVAALAGCSEETSTGSLDVDATPIADSGEVVCPTLQTLCNGRCVDLSSDQSACGSCGNVCGADERCLGGQCACRAGLVGCDDRCVDLADDDANCGACGTTCSANTTCEAGRCVDACDDGAALCGDDCVDLRVDNAHCGACDAPCSAGPNATAVCVDGACITSCDPNYYRLGDAPDCAYFCAPTAPGEDVCDGEDNDCDGLIDDADPDAAPVPCATDAGVCNGAVRRCSDPECGATVFEPHALANGDRYQTEELGLCDGRDNDCDGEVDEGCCGFDVTISLVASPNAAWDDTLFATAVTRRTNAGYQWLVHALPADRSPGWIGALEPGETLVEAWRVPSVAAHGESMDVQVLADGERLDWVVTTERGVERGETGLDGGVITPFAPLAWPGAPTDGTAVRRFSITPSRDAVATVVSSAPTRERLQVASEVDGAWVAWQSPEFDTVERLALLRTSDGVRACATTGEADTFTLRCWQFDPMHGDPEQVVARSVPGSTRLQSAVTDDDGVSVYHGDGSIDCAGACMVPLLRTTLRRDGTIETVDTGLIAAFGLTYAGVGPAGETWLSVFQVQTIDRDGILALLELRRRSDRAYERVARLTEVSTPSIVGPLYDESRLWMLQATIAPTPPATDLGWTLLPFSHDGTALCGPLGP